MTVEEFVNEWDNESPTLLVHTSGSTGKPKPIVVEKRRMAASAITTCRFLGLKQGDTTLLCMPLDYIAGKMVVVRSIVCGLRLISVKPSSHPLATLDKAPTFAAMIPMQVYNTMQVEHERNLLEQTKHLIIGGGAIDESLERQLKALPNAVWSTYGMTETLSHIALRRINGEEASLWYTPLDGVTVRLNDDGCLAIDAPAVCATTLTTNDRAVLANDGRRFRIIGRKDNVVCSGGIKIQMEEVERALAGHLHAPFMVTKRHDVRFGEVVVLLTESDDVESTRALCEQHLPKYWQPRVYLHVSRLPLTETGKPARKEAETIASS